MTGRERKRRGRKDGRRFKRMVGESVLSIKRSETNTERVEKKSIDLKWWGPNIEKAQDYVT